MLNASGGAAEQQLEQESVYIRTRSKVDFIKHIQLYIEDHPHTLIPIQRVVYQN